MDIGVELDERH